MVLVVLPSTVFSVQMELFSNNSTLSVIGGLMWTAQLLKTFILSMMRLLQRGRLILLGEVIKEEDVEVQVLKEQHQQTGTLTVHQAIALKLLAGMLVIRGISTWKIMLTMILLFQLTV